MEGVPLSTLKPGTTWEIVLSCMHFLTSVNLIWIWGIGAFGEWLDWPGCLYIRSTYQYCTGSYYYGNTCCIEGNIGCCGSSSYSYYGYGYTPSYASVLGLIKVSFSLEIVIWLFQVGVLWWQSFLCGCGCVKDNGEPSGGCACCHRTQRCGGRKRECVWKVFSCSKYTFTGLGILQMVDFIVHFLNLFFGLIAYVSFISNNSINKMQSLGASFSDSNGPTFTVVGIILEAIYLLTLILQAWIGYAKNRCCVPANQRQLQQQIQQQIQQSPNEVHSGSITTTVIKVGTVVGSSSYPSSPSQNPIPSAPPAFDNKSRLQESLSCPICHEGYDIGYRIPKQLRCFHTFCSVCLTSIMSETHIQCPNCRDVSPLPTGGLSPNYALLDILQATNGMKISDAKGEENYDDQEEGIVRTSAPAGQGQGVNERYRIHTVLSSIIVSLGACAWIFWIIGLSANWLIQNYDNYNYYSGYYSCYRLSPSGIYCVNYPSNSGGYPYYDNSDSCCPNNTTLACCDLDFYYASRNNYNGFQTDFTRYLLALAGALCISFIGWIFEIVIVWWHTLNYGGCCKCCGPCLNREKNCIGNKRFCYIERYNLCGQKVQAVVYFQLFDLIGKCITLIIGIATILRFESNETIQQLLAIGSTRKAGYSCTIVAMVLDLICLGLLWLLMKKPST